MRRQIDTRVEGHRPKQYCTFVGTRSMLQHTLDRAIFMVLPEQVVTVIGRDHGKFLAEAKSLAMPGSIIAQPFNFGTAPGILLPTAYVIDRDPQATIIVLPSDHFVHPEKLFLEYVVQAFQCVDERPDRLILMGATPDRPETDYGWIVADSAQELPGSNVVRLPLLRVKKFREKPGIDEAHALLSQDSFWNTMVIACKAETLWALSRRCLPEMMGRFDAFRQILREVREGKVSPESEASALTDLYRDLTPADFSKDILEQITAQVLVMPMAGVTWCDWGRPQRVAESLIRLGREPVLGSEQSRDVLEPETDSRQAAIDTHKTQGRNAIEKHSLSCARYGVELRGVSSHAEANDLAQVVRVLNGHAGQVLVFDRQSRSLLLEGTVEQVAKALDTLTMRSAEDVFANPGEP